MNKIYLYLQGINLMATLWGNRVVGSFFPLVFVSFFFIRILNSVKLVMG